MIRRLGIGVAVLFVVLQLVPYGRDHENPPTTGSPTWDSPQTEQLARKACFDCHSHETRWPWYSSIAPISWLVQDHVDEGRETLNFSAWDKGHGEADESAETVREGEMPPAYYFPLHPEARLTDAEKEQLIAGLEKTFGEAAEGEEAPAGEAPPADAPSEPAPAGEAPAPPTTP